MTTYVVQVAGDSWTVTATALPLPTGAATEATLALVKAKTDNLDVALSTLTKPADQQHAIVDRITPPILTKGTQGATGYSTQDLKDAGRSQIYVNWEDQAGSATEAALVNFTTGTRAGANLTGATNLTVTAGKTLRIQAIVIFLKDTAATLVWSKVRIRQAASGITNASPIIAGAQIAIPATTPVALEGNQIVIPIPDGLEVAGGQQVTMTHIESSATGTITYGFIGYEY